MIRKPIFFVSHPWTASEDVILLNTIQSNKNRINWKNIVSILKNKTIKECQNRYIQINPLFNRGQWSKDEDILLLKLINKLGLKWAKISKLLRTRSGKQIRDHYLNELDSSQNKKVFSLDEEIEILERFKQYGTAWRKYKKHFRGRSADRIKCRYYSSLKNNRNLYFVLKSLNDKEENTNTMSQESSCAKLLLNEF